MPKIDISSAPLVKGTPYSPPHDAPCRSRENRRLAVVAGLTQFGVNLTRLPPGAWSSQRHWHSKEDEFVYLVEGEAVLVTDAGEEILRAGDCAGFKAGVRNGHCLQNRSDRDVVFLAIGSREDEDWCVYSDIDMQLLPGRYSGGSQYARKDGTPLK
jgi:uncharacterized cupin superfamily protein